MTPQTPPDFRRLGCGECVDGAGLGFDFTMAFQPIVDIDAREVFAHEALVRGLNGEGASHVIAQVDASSRYRFDQACRVKAIKLAAELGMTSVLSINFMPNAVYRPELCIRTSLAAADTYGFPVDRLMFEVTEGEKIDDHAHLHGILGHYRARGFKTAIDDFGAGYAGLNLLADLPVDIVKLDMALIRNMDGDRVRRAIVEGIVNVCNALEITPIAEGVETRGELGVLRDLGIRLFQGYLFAKPSFQSLPAVDYSALDV